MTTFASFEAELREAIKDLRPEAIQRDLAAFAKRRLAEEIGSGRASPTYERIVNGRRGAPEESVKVPGPIVYIFSNWRPVIEFAMAELQKFSPKKSGRYAASFIVVVGGRVIRNFNEIPPKAEVLIINHQPYTRKVETGANKTGARHFQRASNSINGKWRGVFNSKMVYLKPGSGLHPDIPYILKGSSGRRKDRQAGQPITYPVLSIQAG